MWDLPKTSLIRLILAHDSGMIGNRIDNVPEVEDPRVRNTQSFVETCSSEVCFLSSPRFYRLSTLDYGFYFCPNLVKLIH